MTNRKTTYNATSLELCLGSDVSFRIYAVIVGAGYSYRESFGNVRPILNLSWQERLVSCQARH